MKIRALTAFNCGGPVKFGDTIEVSDKNGAGLIRDGLAVAVEAVAESKPAEEPKQEPKAEAKADKPKK